MLTIEDIRNPKRKSGFNFVATHPSWKTSEGDRFRAQYQKVKPHVYGPTRSSAEQAAQDYCNLVNGIPIMTVEDLRNPKRKSGFDHVGQRNDRPETTKQFQASRRLRPGGGSGYRWAGPRRATAAEAAQDYCDYINSQAVAHTASLNSAGHGSLRDAIERDEEVEAALGVLRDARAQRQGRQGYVYLIGVRGDDYGVKIGYSVKPEARVGELQTGNPRILELLASMPGTKADERRIHTEYIEDNLVGEWFAPSESLLAEFGLDYHAWASSIYGAITAPEGKLVV